MDGGERVDLIGVVLLLLSPSSRGSVSNADDGTSTSSVNATPPTPATSPTLTFTEAPMVASSIALGSNNSGDENACCSSLFCCSCCIALVLSVVVDCSSVSCSCCSELRMEDDEDGNCRGIEAIDSIDEEDAAWPTRVRGAMMRLVAKEEGTMMYPLLTVERNRTTAAAVADDGIVAAL